jgi:short-subunit dehydrogenase
MSPEGKRVFVTGGLGGIGRPLVDLLLAAGAVVTVTDRAQHGASNGAGYIRADLGDALSLQSLCEALQTTPQDILVNLAGLNAFCEFQKQIPAELESMLNVNLLAPMRLSQAALPGMLKRGSGQIVNIGSVVGSIGLPHFTAYAATKAGVKGFSEALRRELTGSGVSVTHIAPRAVRTPMNHGAIGEFNKRSHTAEDPPEKVARRILLAMEREEANVTIGFPEKLFVKLNTLWPSIVDGPLNKNRQIAATILAARS